ncbi:hypothetical protein IGI37_003737 [Enterococcus sp. AZ194]|uniref:hypothetical protein n=1 Tax=Enterococcus sp. AZ194 TaxID=2774629 RepID=UPI003F2527DE
MIWMNWLVAMGLIGLLILLGYRWLVQLQLNQLKRTLSPTLQKKLRRIQQRETTKHIKVLIYWGIFLSFFLGLMTYSIFQLERSTSQLSSENIRIKEELNKLKEKQAYFYQSQERASYPFEGLGFKNEAWKKLFLEKNQRKTLSEMEQLFDKKLLPYFGQVVTIFSIDTSLKEVTLAIQMDDDLNQKDLLRKNMDTLVDELKEVKEVGQVQFQVVSKDKTNEYSRIYVRENNDFVKQVDTEKRMEKGKG